MKLLSKIVLVVYLLILLWLVLFKFSFDIPSVLLNFQARSFNLIPFLDFFKGSAREVFDNCIIFIPFGLLLSVNYKTVAIGQKLKYIAIFSIAVEMIQFIFAIGVTDITDVIANTLGGLLGLKLYELGVKYVDEDKQDKFILVSIVILLTILMLFRFFVLRVRY